MLLNARNQKLKLPTSTVGQFNLRDVRIPLLVGVGVELLFIDLRTLQLIEGVLLQYADDLSVLSCTYASCFENTILVGSHLADWVQSMLPQGTDLLK